ncbi:MAG: FAD-linked oxidase C-terminal domain-containing protein [Chloroflexota bacterium]|nr:FAD-linked oxidase C-terminal domain-containing protein [Chloroflexota bacterium]
MQTGELVKSLEAIVGRDAVFHHPDDLFVFEYDGSIDKAFPLAVVLPANTQQVSRVVALACKAGVPIVPRGAGTGLSAGAIPVQGGIQIVLTRMNKILEIDTVNRLAVVEPGVANLALDIEAHKHGLRYAPDPSSQRVCTIGGNVAENAGGPHCLALGVTTNHVLGLEVVLEDGAVTWLGGVTQDCPGYDLRGAFIGSEGTFGITTRIVVRLLPLPEAIKTLLAIFPDVDSCSTAVSSIIGHGIVPATLEMMDASMVKAVQTALKMGYPEDAGAVLLIELEGLREDIAETAQEVDSILRETGATEVRSAEDAKERERLWQGRKGALGALGSLAPNYYLVDGVVPRTRLPEALREVARISQRYNTPIANLLHAGDGNLHPCILFDEREPGALKKVVEMGGEVIKACVALGGVPTGEHGVGLEKAEYLPLVFTPDDLETMVKVKRAYSPRELFNPGKIFPGGEKLAPGSDRGLAPAAQRQAIARAGPDATV